MSDPSSRRILAYAGSSQDDVAFRVARPCSALEAARSLGLPRAGLSSALEGGALRRADDPGRRLRRDEMLETGDELVFHLAPPAEPLPASDGEAVVIWHDRFILAADKPAGILVHSDGTGSAAAKDTLTSRVQGFLIREAAASGMRPLVPQAVQRLDRETTGLCLFSLCPEFQPALDAQVAGHGMRKRYLCLVRGAFPGGTTTVDAPIGRDRHDARRMRAGGGGKPAITTFRLLERRDGCSLLLAELGTGRRHQIRVHLASRGFPIVGDELYGGARSREGLMLHALSETPVHPVTGETLRLETPWPARFGRPVAL